MADHKSQHFTPRCLLKPFTLDGQGKAINLFAFGLDKLIRNAPAKHQCARDYLYGADGQLEAALAKIEGAYGGAYKAVCDGKENDEVLDHLRFFAHLQLRRTEMAVRRMAAIEQDVFKEVFGENEPEHPPTEYYMKTSIGICVETDNQLADLTVRIIDNRSRIDFVIADDPAVFANRYSLQRLKQNSFGMASSGLMLAMPLSPRLGLICYDNKVYTATKLTNGRIVVRTDKDAEAFNDLQFLAASTSIYFSDWETRDYVRNTFNAAKNRRVANPTKFTWLLSIGKDGAGNEIYKPVTKEETEAPNSRSMIHQESVFPAPSSWLSDLKFRSKIKTFSNGTGIGHVRKQEWLER